MRISFHYNWPPGDKFVRVSLGLANIEDPNSLFRVGVVKKEDQTKVYWQGSEWLTHEQVSEITFDVERGDKVVVEKQNKDSGATEIRHAWDTESEWPAEANGASLTVVPYDF